MAIINRGHNICFQFRHKCRHAWLTLLGLTLCLCGLANTGTAAPHPQLRIAVAANFSDTLNQITRLFERKSHVNVVLTTASSGKIYAQLLHGAPFDLFFSADADKPARLIQQQLADDQSLVTYAHGLLAFCLSAPSFQKADLQAPQNKLNRDLVIRWLSQPGHKIAIANPRLAPYGKAAKETLQQMGVKQSHLIQGENINHSFQYVASGNANAGFVAWSMVVAAKDKRIQPQQCWPVPDTLHQPIQQDAVLLSASTNKQVARDFLDFIRSPAIQKMIASHGYKLP